MMDNMEKIKLLIKENHQFNTLQLKLGTIYQNGILNQQHWDEGRALKPEDTVMSCRLYETECIIMAKLTKQKVNC